jgi:small-conductance mechanosensitive channel
MFANAIPALLALQLPQTSFLEKVTLGNVFEGVMIILIAWIGIRLSSRLFNLLSEKIPRARFLTKMLEPATRIGLWFLAVLFIINILAPSDNTIFASIASLGLALGLGAQDLIKNVIGGLVVLIDRPYQLGDRVKIGDAYGEIDHIGLRSTKLTTPDDTRVTIPNLDILNRQVFNANSGVPDCQVVTDLYLPPETDPDLALEIGFEAAACSPYLLVQKKIVTLVAHGFSDSPYLRLRIKSYVYDHRYEPRMMSDITRRATKEFLRLGVLKGWRLDSVPRNSAD